MIKKGGSEPYMLKQTSASNSDFIDFKNQNLVKLYMIFY